MRRLRDAPLRIRLIGTILIVSSLTLLAAGTLLVGFEIRNAHARAERYLVGLAELVGLAARDALYRDEPEMAEASLRVLTVRMNIVGAAIYDRDQRLFAGYRPPRVIAPPLPAQPGPPGLDLEGEHATLFQPIPSLGGPIGTVYLEADLSALESRLRRYVLIVLGALAMLLSLSLALAVLLQRGISEPILALARVSREVAERRDYSLRAHKRGDDEIGRLTEAFNAMLAQIQDKDRALRELNASLEQRVGARTAELEALNRELESFSYSVSHDLRAPLRGIDGFSRILEEDYGDCLDAEGHRLIGVIRDNCARMRTLIDELLSFSRLGRQALTLQTVDMHALVAQLLEELSSDPDAAPPQVVLEALPPAQADPVLIRQVWANLLGNAAKFSAQAPQPRVRVWAPPAQGERVYAVSDNGVGFDMRDYERLFGVFQRLHSAQEFPGTGVGLATAARIVARHGGRIWAESRPGAGATFYFSLPGAHIE